MASQLAEAELDAPAPAIFTYDRDGESYRHWKVVFGRYGEHFEVRPVELGRSDGKWIEVVKGLPAGTRYAATGSFILKADLGKAGASHDH